MKAPLVVVLLCACATAPKVAPVEQHAGPPHVPQALDLAVRAMDQESIALLPAALEQAKTGLMALGHPVIGEGAPLRVELDVGPISRSSTGASACVSGRIIREGQSFSAVEFRNDSCGRSARQGSWFPTGNAGVDALAALAMMGAGGGVITSFDRPEVGAALVHSELGPLLPRISAAAQR
jgi:hypothetical protein